MRTHRRVSALIVLACILACARWAWPPSPMSDCSSAPRSQSSDVEQVFGSKFSDVSFDTSFLFGGKAALFFDPSILGGNLGLELEVYVFQPDVGEQVVQGMFPGFTGPATVGSRTST